MPPASPPPPPPSALPPGHTAAQGGWADAEAVLGPAHPLVAVLRSTETASEQTVAIGGVLAADLIVVLEHAPLGLPLALPLALALACVAAQIALGLRLAHLVWRRRAVCRQLIIDGGANLPLHAVEREVDRLGAARCRTTLAKAINRLTDEATYPRSRQVFEPMIFHLAVVRAVVAELREIARLLQSGHVDVRGVACIESLLVSGESPLYGVQADVLRDELGRARYFLAGSPLPLTRKEHRIMPDDHKDVASRDLMIGFGILGTCAVLATLFAIIASL
jgi:hypothetical protein